MRLASLQTGWRALVPLVVVGIVALGTAVGLQASAASGPPQRTVAQLLSDLRALDPPGYTGVVVQKANLVTGSLADRTQFSLSTLLAGTHTIKVWYGGPDRQRIAVLTASGESDLFRDGSQIWQWDSGSRQATSSTSTSGDLPPADRIPVDGTAVTPDDLARRAVAAIGPSTTVELDSPTTVAGRAAYRLVIEPQASSGTRIGRIVLAVDGETRMPLSAQVYARGIDREPAIDLSFTRISLVVPDEQTFQFTPPPDATVNAVDANNPTAVSPDPLLGPLATETRGSGWTRIAIFTPADRSETSRQNLVGQFGGGLAAVSGSWGSGQLLQTALLTMVFLDDGRIAVGAVDPSALYDAL